MPRSDCLKFMPVLKGEAPWLVRKGGRGSPARAWGWPARGRSGCPVRVSFRVVSLPAVAAVAFVLATRAFAGTIVDSVVVTKSERRMVLLNGDVPVREYGIALGASPTGHKTEEGDGRTPEGRYTIDWRKTDSAFHRALHISYPNPEDYQRAAERGVAPGGSIMIHGQKNGLGWLSWISQSFDWTEGCIAVTNEEIEEIWRLVPDGTPILIKP